MPRVARIYSEFLHVIIRGIGKQVLFEDDSDCRFFLAKLKMFKDETHITILAYCLMENHVHLLVRDPEGSIATLMKKIGVCYSGYFNKKYERIGHLFQDRFKSCVIENDEYLLSAYRYILKNPEKAGLGKANDYRWNSYREYGEKGKIADSSFLENLIGPKEVLDSFLEIKDEREHLEFFKPIKDDFWANKIIQDTLKIASGMQLQQMGKKQRDDSIKLLKTKGLSTHQIERLTGLSKGIIYKACKSA